MVLLYFALPALLHGQDWAKARLEQSSRHGEYVTIHEKSGRDLQAWVVYPEVNKKAPVVVLIHEIFGLTDWAREISDEVAREGYIVIAPDLLSGLGAAAHAGDSSPGAKAGQTATPDASHMHPETPFGASGSAFVPVMPGGTSAFPDQSSVVRAVSSLPDSQVLADLNAAADYGSQLPAANGKLFVAGFCWGGGKSFLFSTQRSDLGAAFVFYGPPPPPDAMKTIHAPVYGFYAGNDTRITSTIDMARTAMKQSDKTYRPETYDGAGHGFMRAGEAPGASTADMIARKAAFARWVELMHPAQ